MCKVRLAREVAAWSFDVLQPIDNSRSCLQRSPLADITWAGW